MIWESLELAREYTKIWWFNEAPGDDLKIRSVFFPTVSVVVVRFSSVTSSFIPSSPSSPILSSWNAVRLTIPKGDHGQSSYDLVQMQFKLF